MKKSMTMNLTLINNHTWIKLGKNYRLINTQSNALKIVFVLISARWVVSLMQILHGIQNVKIGRIELSVSSMKEPLNHAVICKYNINNIKLMVILKVKQLM